MADDAASGQSVMVLLSGGIDSSACVAFFLEGGYHVEGLFVDYGQLAAAQEATASAAVANHYGIGVKTVRCHGASEKSGGLIMGRNAFLLFTGLLEMEVRSGLLAMGIHAGTDYWDCSPDFVATVQAMFDAYSDGKVRLSAPFLEWSKRDIWDFCISRQVPLALTYSCELGRRQPCGDCLSCRDLEALHVRLEQAS